MKKIYSLAFCSLYPLSLSASAVDFTDHFNVNASLALLSDYRSMGTSRTLGDPALQGYAQVTHIDSGVYIGLWSSSYDVGKPFKAYREDAYLLGKYLALNDDVDLDISIGRYEYPNQASFDLWEIYAVSNIYGVRLKFVYDYEIKDQPNQRSFMAGYNFLLPLQTTLFVGYGWNDLNVDIYSGSDHKRQTYRNWEATFTTEMLGLAWSASFIDTDLSKHECKYGTGYNDLCSSTVVFGMTKNF